MKERACITCSKAVQVDVFHSEKKWPKGEHERSGLWRDSAHTQRDIAARRHLDNTGSKRAKAPKEHRLIVLLNPDEFAGHCSCGAWENRHHDRDIMVRAYRDHLDASTPMAKRTVMGGPRGLDAHKSEFRARTEPQDGTSQIRACEFPFRTAEISLSARATTIGFRVYPYRETIGVLVGDDSYPVALLQESQLESIIEAGIKALNAVRSLRGGVIGPHVVRGYCFDTVGLLVESSELLEKSTPKTKRKGKLKPSRRKG